MGLDITVHKEIVKVDEADVPMHRGDIDWDTAWEEGFVKTFVYDGFERSLGGLDQNGWAKSVGETYGFRAGSYSGYGHWREELAQMALGVSAGTVWANPAHYQDKPFFELLNFADNEGTIGPEACAELAEDFLNFHGKARETFTEAYDFERYETWMLACQDAANSGMIQLH